MITGDMHYGAVHRLAEAGQPGDTVWEIAAGPSGSPINIAADLVVAREQLPVTVAEHSCCVFTADPEARSLIIDFLGNDGVVLASQTIVV